MKINVAPNNMEKYLAFLLGYDLVFIDSLLFVNLSLDKLLNSLPKEELKYASKEIVI